MPTARTALGAAVVGDTLYTVGGYAGTSLATVEAYHAVAGVLANDSDEHGRAPGENNVPLTAQVETGPTHAASFTLYDDGTFTYTPAANYNGTDQFTYRALDSLNNASTPATVTITSTPSTIRRWLRLVRADSQRKAARWHSMGPARRTWTATCSATTGSSATARPAGAHSDACLRGQRRVHRDGHCDRRQRRHGQRHACGDGPERSAMAEAGGPYTGNEGSDITLTAGASSDPGNDSLIYEWDLNHNGTYETTGLTATFNWTADGTFLVGLRVTDDDGASATGTATVTVSNVAPHADAGGPYIVELGTGVGLDASGSTDPGHDIASYAWDLDSDGQFDDATG